MAAPERMFLPVDGFDGVVAATEVFVLAPAPATAAPPAATDTGAAPEPLTSSAVDAAVVVFPGNPGIAGCYTLFLERLREEWGHRAGLARGSVRFLAVSYAGHVVPPPPAASTTAAAAAAPPSQQQKNQRTRFTLEEQVEHKLRFLRQHVLPHTRRELLLVGHSIGAHIALQCALQLRQEQQHQQQQQQQPSSPPPLLRIAPVLLTPFLSSNPPCPRQRAVRRLASCHAVAGAAATLAGRALAALPLPESLHLRLAAWASGADHVAACKGIAGLLAPGVVDSALALAKDEFATLPEGVSGLPLADLEKCGEACVIAGPGDMWFPRAQYEAVERRFGLAAAGEGAGTGGSGGSRGDGDGDDPQHAAAASPPLAAIWDPAISHLFGCSARETVCVAAHVAGWAEGQALAGGRRGAADEAAALAPQ